MLIQLNLVISYVVAQNLKAMIQEVVLRQLDSFLRSAKEETKSDQRHWVGLKFVGKNLQYLLGT